MNNHARLGQFGAEGRDDRNAVEDSIHRIFRRALDAGQDLLFAKRDAQLLVGFQDLGIDLIEGLGPLLGLGGGIVVQRLIVGGHIGDLGPGRLVHGLPAFQRLEPPVQQPVRLALLGRDEADRVGAQADGCELLFDIGDEAVLVGLQALDGLDGFPGGGHQAVSASG
jgi:hypothetical protein